MKLLALLSLIMTTACDGGTKFHNVERNVHYGDQVTFVFTEDNLFFSRQCENHGKVVATVNYEGFFVQYRKYMVESRCNNQEYPQYIWVLAEDILDVTEATLK